MPPFADTASELKIVKATLPAAQAAGAVNGADVDTIGFRESLWVLHVGTPGSSGTIDAKLQEAPDSGTGTAGTYADITGATFTQKTAAGISYLRAKHDAPRKRWMRIVTTVAVATSPLSAECILTNPTVEPGGGVAAVVASTPGQTPEKVI